MQGEGERRIPDFLDFIFSPTSRIYTTFEGEVKLWVFWSKEEGKDCPDQTNKTLSSCDLTETRTIDFNFKEYLLSALRKYASIWDDDDDDYDDAVSNFLVQFWAPKTIGGQLMLTTSHQPFALKRIEKGLCEYRKHCINLEFNVNGDGEEFGGVIGQVFRHGKVKSHSMIESYSVKRYPPRGFALKCGVWSFCAVPVFYPSGRCCAGVLEFLYTCDADMGPYSIYSLPKYLLEMEESTEDGVIIDEINEALQVVCTTHQLPLAQIWIPCCTSPDERCHFPYLSCSDKFSSSISQDEMDDDVEEFRYAFCSGEKLTKGQGVVGKAFSDHKPCFCRDVTQLSTAQYPFSDDARDYELTGCYAICLHSTLTRNHNYVLEFFLPHNWNIISGDPQTFLKSLSATVKKQLPDFKICSGEGPFEEVGNDEPYSFVISQTTSVQPIPESFANESETMQNELVAETAIDNGSDNFGLKQNGIVSSHLEKKVEILRRDSRKEVGEELIVEVVTNDKITPALPPMPESLPNETEVVQLLDDELTEETVMQNESNVLVAEQNNIGVTSSERICRVETSEIEHETNQLGCEDLKQNLGKKLDDAADSRRARKNKLNVGIAEQSSVPVTSSSGRISSRAEALEESEYRTTVIEISREDLKQNLGKKLDNVANSRRVRKNELNVGVAKQSSVPVISSSGRISSRAEAMEESKYRTTVIEISREDLIKCFGMKLDEVSKFFGVSRSSVQRACRIHGIKKWPSLMTNKVNTSSTSNLKHVKEVVPKKRKKVNVSSTSNLEHVKEVFPKEKKKFINPSSTSSLKHMKEVVPKKKKKVNPSCSHTITNVTPQAAVGTVTTKVTYRDDTVRFDLPFASRKSDLMEKVTQRLPLNGVSFNIKYRDEENDLILIAGDEDLEKCISISRSLGKCTMLVLPITNHVP